jgi:electron transfer flavoprotein beta subunit
VARGGGPVKIVVCVKQVPSSEARILVAGDGSSIDRTGVELVLNPYDEYALEEGLRTREKFGGTLTVLALGPAKAEETLRHALALGADRAIHVKEEALLGADPLGVARILAAAVRPLEPDLLLFGKVAIDVENHGTGVAVAELLGIPHVSVVSAIEWKDEGHLMVHREIEGAAEVVEVTLPASLTANKGLNEPRYPKLPGIMKAKKIPIEEATAAGLGLEAAQVGAAGAQAMISRLEPPPARTEGKKFAGDPREAVVAVLRSLHDERKLL